MRIIIRVPLTLMPMAALAGTPEPKDFAWQPHPGAAVPLGQRFTDETGRGVTLRDVSGTPMILALGHFRCPAPCSVVRGNLVAALDGSRLAVLSIDPAEPAKDAAKAKADDLARSSGADERNWHYLAGDPAPVARSVGFKANGLARRSSP